MKQIELEIGKNCNAFDIPDGVKKVTVKQAGNKIVIEMVQEAKEPKPGDVMINHMGNVYIFKSVWDDKGHKVFAWFGEDGSLLFDGWSFSGRPATPEEAQPLWDALEKAGKRWNPETMQVEDLPEICRIRKWVENNLKPGRYDHARLSLAIDMYLEYREGEK